MTNKHTPGPWYTDESEHDAPYQDIKIKAGKHHTVCTVWIDDAPVRDFNAAQKANARLIAAAPELLEALQLCRQHMYNHSSNTSDNAFDKLCAAIAKATNTM